MASATPLYGAIIMSTEECNEKPPALIAHELAPDQERKGQ